MLNFLKHIQKRLVYYISAIMIIGVIVGNFVNTAFLKNLIVPFTLLMIFPMMVVLDYKKIVSKCNFRAQAITQAINFIFYPLFGFLVAQIFFKDNQAAYMGIILISLIPTSGMTISWTGFAGGNINLAIKMTIIGLVLGSVLAPFYSSLLMGGSDVVPIWRIFNQIIVVIVVPLIFGFILQKLLIKKFGEKRFNQEVKKKFPPFASIGVLGSIFIAMSLKSKMILQEPLLIFKMLLILMSYYFVAFVVVVIIGRKFLNKEDAIAFVYSTVIRNLSISLAIALVAFEQAGPEIAIIITVAYLVQVQSAAWSVKMLKI